MSKLGHDIEDFPPLSVLPVRLDISPDIFKHPNMIEMQAICTVALGEDKQVIGTANTQRTELYGWRNPVDPHRDSRKEQKRTVMYFCLLSGGTTIFCRDDDGNEYQATPEPGEIVRLVDKFVHWTAGDGDCIALFMGVFFRPNDEHVIKVMSRGLARLSKPKVYFAPRSVASDGILRNDEVYAAHEFGSEYYKLRRVAAARANLDILTCKICCETAVKIDKFWPYDDEHRCHDHSK